LLNVLYNDATTLYVSDTNFQQLDPYNNTLWTVAPAAGTGYVIEANVLTLDTKWATLPNTDGTLQFQTGAIYALTPNATNFSGFSYYCVIRDKWITRTGMASLYGAAVPADMSLEKTGDKGGVYESGHTATSSTSMSVTSTGAGWVPGERRNYALRITSGTANGQRVEIIGNTADTLFLKRPFNINP